MFPEMLQRGLESAVEGLAETLQPEAAFTWDNQGFYRQLRDFNQWILEFNWLLCENKGSP